VSLNCCTDVAVPFASARECAFIDWSCDLAVQTLIPFHVKNIHIPRLLNTCLATQILLHPHQRAFIQRKQQPQLSIKGIFTPPATHLHNSPSHLTHHSHPPSHHTHPIRDVTQHARHPPQARRRAQQTRRRIILRRRKTRASCQGARGRSCECGVSECAAVGYRCAGQLTRERFKERLTCLGCCESRTVWADGTTTGEPGCG
jgi:hypothetical protein